MLTCCNSLVAPAFEQKRTPLNYYMRTLRITALIASFVPWECKQAIISSQEDKQGIKFKGGAIKCCKYKKLLPLIFHFVWVTAGNVSSIGRLHYTFYVLFYFILFAVDIIIFDPNNLLSFQWLLAQSVRALESFKADVGCSSPSRSKTDNRLQNIQMVDYCRVNIGKNLLVNRLTILNNQINYEWLNLSYDAFKLRCKNILLIFWLRLFDL